MLGRFVVAVAENDHQFANAITELDLHGLESQGELLHNLFLGELSLELLEVE